MLRQLLRSHFATAFLGLLIPHTLTATNLPKPLVKLADGSLVQGRCEKVSSWENDERSGIVWEFLSIPYAEPPVGNLRFKPPFPAKPWKNNVLNATKIGPICPQTMYDEVVTQMSEDCLLLNVWVPKGRQRNSNVAAKRPKLPVMVWIHGGGYFAGSSFQKRLNGKVLANYGKVIVASMNYRLGVLGFLYTGSKTHAPGNMGLMDQTLALKWIHTNIEKFGGDPGNVTIFGLSAGGASVSFHFFLPNSRPYFKRAIVSSGSALNLWAISSKKVMQNRALHLASAVGCAADGNKTTADWAAIIDCLISKPFQELLDINQSPFTEHFLTLTWTPVADGTFLPDIPQNLLNTGRFKQLDFIFGTVSNEASASFPLYYNQTFPDLTSSPTKLEAHKFRRLFREMLPEIYSNSDEVYNTVYEHYLNWFDVPSFHQDSESIDVKYLESMASDAHFTCRCLKLAAEYSRVGSRVFQYSFRYKTPSFVDWASTPHASDEKFMFGLVEIPKEFNLTRVERRLSENMMELWTNFAKTGNPNVNNDGSLAKTTAARQWLPFGTEKNYYIMDGLNNRPDKNYKSKHCRLWKRIDKKFPPVA